MSISSRPRSESPPPRVPSPEHPLQPLPVRRRPRPLKFPPGLQVPPPSLEKSRSMGDMNRASGGSKAGASASEIGSPMPKRITRLSLPPKSVLKTPPVTPSTYRTIPSPTRSTLSKRSSSRSLSLAIPYLSPPPSPTLASPPPPVPPIPSFAFLSAPAVDSPKPLSRKSSTAPIELPDVISPISEPLPAPWPKSKKHQLTPTLPRESKGLSCLGFFSLKNPKSQGAKSPTVTRIA